VKSFHDYFAIVHVGSYATVRVWSIDCLSEVRLLIQSMRSGTVIRLMQRSEDYPLFYWEYTVQ